MRDLPLTLLHLVVAVAKLCGPGGVRGLIAENLVLKQQLIVLRRARRRAPNLTRRDRLLCGFWSLIHSQGTPRHLSTDHDPLFEAHRWRANLRILEIDEIKTMPYAPPSHPFVERLIGTMRREFLDHVIFWNACDLERKLSEFQAYYNAARSHASLDGHTPLTLAGGHPMAPADLNHVRWVSQQGPRPVFRRRLTNSRRTP